MGFLKRFVRNTFRDGQPHDTRSSFESLTEEQLETHLRISRYGEFRLTDAVRPSYDLQVIPRAGYRHDVYQDDESSVEIPVIMGAASQEIILDLFIDLLDPIGDQVDVVLETSHEISHGRHRDLNRDEIDLPVLKSILWEYEDLLLDDGCTGIAVMNSQIPVEVQLDEHKLLIMYGADLSAFETLLAQYDIERNEEIQFITEAEHVHSSSDELSQKFEELKYRLGIDD